MVKMFLNRAMAIPTALNRDEEEIASSSRSSLVSVTNEQLPFKILEETSIFFKFNATGRSLLIKFKRRARYYGLSQGMHYNTYELPSR